MVGRVAAPVPAPGPLHEDGAGNKIPDIGTSRNTLLGNDVVDDEIVKLIDGDMFGCDDSAAGHRIRNGKEQEVQAAHAAAIEQAKILNQQAVVSPTTLPLLSALSSASQCLSHISNPTS